MTHKNVKTNEIDKCLVSLIENMEIILEIKK
jgi:hypothetical protein